MAAARLRAQLEGRDDFAAPEAVAAELVATHRALLATSRPLYQVRVKPLATTIDIDGHPTAITPGMAVTVEIKTGRRRVIDYLLDPVLRRVAESGGER